MNAEERTKLRQQTIEWMGEKRGGPWDVEPFSGSTVIALLDAIDEIETEHKRVSDGFHKHNYEIEQALGKALGYLSGYPEVAEVDDGSVCVPVDTVTLAQEAAAKLVQMTPHREPLAEGREHLTVSGAFQSDKYPWCPAGFLPLKLTDRTAQAMLLVYAEKRKPVDSEFSRDLHQAVLKAYDKEQAS